MNEEEAQNAQVHFDYNHDSQRTGTNQFNDARCFKVTKLVKKSLRNAFPEDTRTLDYSLLHWRPSQKMRDFSEIMLFDLMRVTVLKDSATLQ